MLEDDEALAIYLERGWAAAVMEIRYKEIAAQENTEEPFLEEIPLGSEAADGMSVIVDRSGQKWIVVDNLFGEAEEIRVPGNAAALYYSRMGARRT